MCKKTEVKWKSIHNVFFTTLLKLGHAFNELCLEVLISQLRFYTIKNSKCTNQGKRKKTSMYFSIARLILAIRVNVLVCYMYI